MTIVKVYSCCASEMILWKTEIMGTLKTRLCYFDSREKVRSITASLPSLQHRRPLWRMMCGNQLIILVTNAKIFSYRLFLDHRSYVALWIHNN